MEYGCAQHEICGFAELYPFADRSGDIKGGAEYAFVYRDPGSVQFPAALCIILYQYVFDEERKACI